MEKLTTATKQLLVRLDEAERIFEKKDNIEADFYNDVKPFVDDVQALLGTWKEEAAHFIDRNRPKYLHHSQLDETEENVSMIAVTCFQPNTSVKRFKEQVSSARYIFEDILNRSQ